MVDMAKARKRGKEIRSFILENVESSSNVIALTVESFRISRQAAYEHIRRLVADGALVHVGRGLYALKTLETWSASMPVRESPHEDVLWRNAIAPRMRNLPDNALSIWNYALTEMYNNVLEHSESATVDIVINKTALGTEMEIADDGVGIFNNIRIALGLSNKRQLVLELIKGRLTTKPDGHKGEGIFFTSRLFDRFYISSGEILLLHEHNSEQDWIYESNEKNSKGTLISMKLRNDTTRTCKEVYDRFVSLDNEPFTRIVIPLRLALESDESLVSRSQAKQLLERTDHFKTVILNFAEVATIGPSFADEIFRVFANKHSQIEIVPINTNKEVMQMIQRARSAR
jgi:anti-sigma regulatory factor (Ser/Thr protein kinase)